MRFVIQNTQHIQKILHVSERMCHPQWVTVTKVQEHVGVWLTQNLNGVLASDCQAVWSYRAVQNNLCLLTRCLDNTLSGWTRVTTPKKWFSASGCDTLLWLSHWSNIQSLENIHTSYSSVHHKSTVRQESKQATKGQHDQTYLFTYSRE